MMPIVSKMFCSSSEVLLTVRKRPHVIGGGGFIVTEADSRQRVIFRVDGCGILGRRGELVLKDTNNTTLLLIYQQQGIVQALSPYRQWKGFTFDYEGLQKQVFILKEPNSCFAMSTAIRLRTEPRTYTTKDWDFEVRGSFSLRACTITDFRGNTVAKVGQKKEVIKELMDSKDVYEVVVRPGMDQAFVVGIISVLDYISHESTSC